MNVWCVYNCESVIVTDANLGSGSFVFLPLSCNDSSRYADCPETDGIICNASVTKLEYNLPGGQKYVEA